MQSLPPTIISSTSRIEIRNTIHYNGFDGVLTRIPLERVSWNQIDVCEKDKACQGNPHTHIMVPAVSVDNFRVSPHTTLQRRPCTRTGIRRDCSLLLVLLSPLHLPLVFCHLLLLLLVVLLVLLIVILLELLLIQMLLELLLIMVLLELPLIVLLLLHLLLANLLHVLLELLLVLLWIHWAVFALSREGSLCEKVRETTIQLNGISTPASPTYDTYKCSVPGYVDE